MEKLIKALFLLILLLGFVILLKHNLDTRRNGVCVQKQQSWLKELKKEHEMKPNLWVYPQCDLTGGFLVQQCNAVTNQCWCVNSEGVEVKGTKVSSLKEQPAACHLNWAQHQLLLWQLYTKGGVSIFNAKESKPMPKIKETVSVPKTHSMTQTKQSAS